MRYRMFVILIGFWVSSTPVRAALQVSPATVVLDNPEATQQLLVRSSALPVDLTRVAMYVSADPKIAIVDSTGLIIPKGEGKTTIAVIHAGEQSSVPIVVSGLVTPTPVSFETQVIPILTYNGCNSGGCHGKAEGKNGFKLSVFGFDTAADHQALVKEARGRRIFPSSPDSSLLLRKATAQLAHGGGKRLAPDGLHYQRLRRWIVEGGQYDPDAPDLTAIEVEPKQQILSIGGTQQLRVIAVTADGKRRDVTLDTQFESNAVTIAEVDRRGGIKASDVPGEASILVRYLGHVTVCRVTIPRPGVKFTRPPENNFIDKLAWNKLEQLGIAPSDVTDDATFMRRVFLDTIGTLPTAAEAREFLADKRADKRAKLIDQLLERPEYADYWAMRWSDLLRVDRDTITPAGSVAFTRWLRKQLVDNRPYDEMVREIITARGDTTAEGPAAIYKALTTPEEMSRSFSQLFLGVRIQCAQCHHHPSERWTQDDYFALAGFFTGVGRKALPGANQAIFAQKGAEMKHPRTGKLVPTQALAASPADFTNVPDRRIVLAKWMTTPDNPFVARAIANRLWAHYFGHGLVEPLDDLRVTNPATNEPLLDELAKQMRDLKFNMKAYTKLLLNSRLYQLSGNPLPSNVTDEQNFSHASPKAIPAEVLLDAISQATASPEKFNGWPEGYRAIQVWDNRMPSYFFRIFGRPVRASVCECERSNEPSITQALHLMNSEEITSKIRSKQGSARKLARSEKKPAEIIDELYLSTVSRFPTEKERALMLTVFEDAGDDRVAAVEDVLWALLNTRGFVYNH
ncbi:MAG: DUF1549 domain-containing protein [Planctomycetes bacterium]|nr:DUF1549 domain-containing protein [Planctomycetota bacterium]